MNIFVMNVVTHLQRHKVLNTPVNLSYKRVQKVSKPGMVVNDAIASAKQEMEAHKEELKNNREANSDD